MQSSNFKAAWHTAIELFPFGRNDGLVVQVSKSDHYPFPRYRVSLGFKSEDGFVHRNISIRVDGQTSLRPVLDATLKSSVSLLQKAEEWIAEDSARESNLYIEEREQKDRKDAGLLKPQVVTGKTSKKKARLANMGGGVS